MGQMDFAKSIKFRTCWHSSGRRYSIVHTYIHTYIHTCILINILYIETTYTHNRSDKKYFQIIMHRSVYIYTMRVWVYAPRSANAPVTVLL